MAQEMQTFDARLASFDLVLHPDKRGSSATKSTKPIAWPHSRPSPAELAHAGFYYNPYETNPDNTVCFLCERALDGWEEDDNPIEEHLTHSTECGWAIMMDIHQHSSNPAEIEDPTSERIAQARQATFGLMWPYDGKRGWVCQSEKMVEGGWYFCPTDDSNDLASCAYCKLSLDGWEPKDDPFNEHYRRSPDCSFFVFANPPGKKTKASRSKKPRASKGSRISTQSAATTTSEAPSLDLDDAMDQSIVSHSSTATKKSKKPSKKTKASRTKREDSVDLGSQMDVDSADYAQPEQPQPKRGTRGKKRTSDLVNKDEPDKADKETTEQPERPVKKRATKSHNSAAEHDEKSTNTPLEETQTKEEPAPEKPKRKRGRPSKKDASSTGRKLSQVSTNSKTTSKSRLPRDSEIDAALEADLETGVPGANEHGIEQPSETSKPRKTSKTGSETAHQSTDDMADNVEDHAQFEPDQEVSPEAKRPAQKQKHKARVKRGSARSEVEENMDIEMDDARPSPPTNAANPERHESLTSVEVNSRDPGQESNLEQDHGAAKRGRKKKATTGKGKKSKKAAEVHPDSESGEPEAKPSEARPSSKEQEPETNGDIREQQEDVNKEDSSRRSSRRISWMAPPKTTERYSDIPHEKQFTRSFTESRTSNVSNPQKDVSPEARKSGGMSPLPSEPKQQSLSPRSSDAENRPPSTRPSASRLPVLSPSKKQLTQTPTARIQSPSKQNVNTGGLKTSHPWVPIDIEDILFAGGSDKENASANGPLNGIKGELTSPEKRMTVEEWILWNAKNGEDRLKRECERLVGQFESEGGRAMRVLEGIECID